ncbi:MAG: HAD family hydrolase [Candidatus Pacearchaeota archaeon]
MKKAIFLDRDGVLIEETGEYISKKQDMKIISVTETLKKLKSKGYLLVVVTNQAAIARGIITEEDLKEMNNFLNECLEKTIDAFYYCPHHPEVYPDIPEYAKKYRVKCNCRKPLPGLLLKASKEMNIDLKKSYMIGDMISDIIAGKSAGCKTIMIESINNKKIISSHIPIDVNTRADFYVKNLNEVLKYIN